MLSSSLENDENIFCSFIMLFMSGKFAGGFEFELPFCESADISEASAELSGEADVFWAFSPSGPIPNDDAKLLSCFILFSSDKI